MNKQDYSRMLGNYKSITIRARGQIIDQLLNDLHTDQLDMIDRAVEQSDLSQARDIIAHIKAMK
jgi:hypothetical protein